MLDAELRRHSIPWSNVTSFGCDNASVMTGVHKGVASFILKENPDVFISGCSCHLLHLAARNGMYFFFYFYFAFQVLHISELLIQYPTIINFQITLDI